MKRAYLVLVPIMVAAACASGGVPEGRIDAGGGGDIDGATGPTYDAAPEPGGFWADCETHSQCESGICYRPDDDDPLGHCSLPCDMTCPNEYECRQVVLGGVSETMVCVPAEDTFCLPCEVNSDCGDSSDFCLEMTGGRFCTIDCTDDPDVCPAGFSCQLIAGDGDIIVGHQCMPINGLCCIDGDGDQRGQGGVCLGPDCDDDNDAVFDDAIEVCDGFDNDCVGGVDVDVTDCDGASCGLGALGYYELPAEECTGGECVAPSAVLCDLYTCDGGGDTGDACATECDGEGDEKCIPTAHCDDDECLEDLVNGEACDEASDCESEHCQNGFCCDSGDCCNAPEDCPTFGTFEPVCDNPAACQGTSGTSTCSSFICGTSGDVADDSACAAETQADDCDWYLPIFCSGDVVQTPPVCPATCDAHADCDPAGFCRPGSFDCVEDLVDGEECSEPAQCKSGHCTNGFCCATGDCCSSALDCPPSYTGAPACTVPTSCQGERDVAECVNSICGTREGEDDDTACDATIAADDCGPYPWVVCTGGVTQDPPMCADSCLSDSGCDTSAYCNAEGACETDEPNGGACSDDDECQSDHCDNGFCCSSGTCCADDGDCGALDQASQCNDAATCQGSRIDGVCTGFQCGPTTLPDDSGCATLQSNDCGLYPSVFCTTSMDQSVNQATLCGDSCGDDDDCDPSARCELGFCVPKQGQGGACEDTSDCTGGGLTCIDGVCCTSTCTGACRACDVDGSGTCMPLDDGTDPESECGSVSCTNYYWDWSGDSCYRKANVTAAEASCGGDNACRTQEEECLDQPDAGSVQINCHDVCQRPDLATCQDDVAGVCNPFNPGTNKTCGVGSCFRSVPTCNGSGGENTCVAGTPTGEVCDHNDNDCDGTADDGLAADSAGNSCGSHLYLGALGENTNSAYTIYSIYPSGDHDWFRQRTIESSNFCIGSEGTYVYRVDLSGEPAGRDYRFEVCWEYHDDAACTLRGCFPSGGQSAPGWVSWTVSGVCGSEDGRDYYIHVWPNGTSPTNYSCMPYRIDTSWTH